MEDQKQRPTFPPLSPDEAPLRPVTKLVVSKRSKKKLFIISGAVGGVAVLALVLGMWFLLRPKPIASTASAPVTAKQALDGRVESASVDMLNLSSQETISANNDDSSLASDASKSAGMVGDGVNEDTF